jgi:hypothetical protein
MPFLWIFGFAGIDWVERGLTRYRYLLFISEGISVRIWTSGALTGLSTVSRPLAFLITYSRDLLAFRVPLR